MKPPILRETDHKGIYNLQDPVKNSKQAKASSPKMSKLAFRFSLIPIGGERTTQWFKNTLWMLEKTIPRERKTKVDTPALSMQFPSLNLQPGNHRAGVTSQELASAIIATIVLIFILVAVMLITIMMQSYTIELLKWINDVHAWSLETRI